MKSFISTCSGSRKVVADQYYYFTHNVYIQEEYWDPLKMMEKDRAAIELRKKNSLTAMASMSGSVAGQDNSTT